MGGIASFIGILLSLPELMGGALGSDVAGLYGAGDYLMIFAVVISLVLLIISLFSVLSALAKSVKEAGAIITPAMIILILLGMCSMIITGTPSVGIFAVPVLGSALVISSVMNFTVTGTAVALSVLSNLAVVAILTVLLGYMFKSERIMFSK